MSPAYALQTAHLSLAVAVKLSAAGRKVRPTRSVKHTHTYMTCKSKIFDHEVGTITHTQTHARTHHAWRIDFTDCVSLPLRLKWNHTALHPPHPTPPHPHIWRCCCSRPQSPPPSHHRPRPYYKSHLTVSVIIPHMLMQQSSSQAK